MRVMAISLLVILLMGISSALEIGFDFPDEIVHGDEFEISVSADSNEIYDVKIYAYSGEKSDKKSEIFNFVESKWQSSYYYLKEAFPDNKEFKIRLKNETEEGKGIICVKLRKTGTSSYKEECKEVMISADDRQKEEDADEEDDENTNENDEDEETNNDEADGLEDYAKLEYDEVIMLNAPIKEQNIMLTNQEKIRKSMAYIFVGFLVIVISFYMIRRI